MRRFGAAALCAIAGAAQAQVPSTAASAGPVAKAPAFELGLSSLLTWTSNSSFGDTGLSTGPASSDTFVELRPRVLFRAEGARLRLTGSASLSGIAYARNTQPGAVEPTAELNARMVAIERLFYLEAGYRASQTSEDPFGARVDGSGTANRLTTSQWRFSPVMEGEAGGDIRYALRNDNTWTREFGSDAASTSGAGGYFGRVTASVERSPRPFGWRLETERSLTRYDDPAEPKLVISTARARLNYALAEDWTFGVRAGYERNNEDPADHDWRSIAGVETRWQPSPRTTLSAFREKRFFGSGWELAFTHRQPRLAWNLGLTRGVDTTPQELFELPASNNVAGLIDAMFTTRFPDPAERARVVRDYMTSQGIPGATQGPISLYSQRFSIVTSRRASVTFNGVRGTLTVSGYSTRTEDAFDAGPFVSGRIESNNLQKGASLLYSHRLTPLTSLSSALDWSRIRSLDLVVPEETTEQGLRLQLNLQLDTTTNAFVGGRYRKIESTVARDGREGSAFVGLDHRF